MESARITAFGTSVFSDISKLAAELDAVNLGQGFPNFDGPPEVAQAAIEAITGGQNQYAVGQGQPALRAAVAAHSQRFYGQSIDPQTQVGITCGATEAIFAAMQAFTVPGDEVVLFEPFYDSYLACAQMAQVVPRFVPIRAPDSGHANWWIDEGELARAFTPKTRLAIVNTPHNPTGKVFTRSELEQIGAHVKRTRAVLLLDEVYEHLAFEGAQHLRAATLPGLEDCTLTVSSGGKSFSFTGWKIGWHLGNRDLVNAVQKAHQWMTFCAPTPLQAGIARALTLPDSYFQSFIADYQRKRDFLNSALESAGFDVLPSQGTYFLMARTDRHRNADEDDVKFCRRLLIEHGVASIPPSVFYRPENAAAARALVRFAFCKTTAVLEKAAERLAGLTR